MTDSVFLVCIADELYGLRSTKNHFESILFFLEIVRDGIESLGAVVLFKAIVF